MNLEDRKIEDIDMREEYEMIPLEPMMYGYGQMNMMPSMGINQSMGMNPWMGMSQFNEDMSMDSFDSMAMMYGDESNNDYDYDYEGLRQLDKEPFRDGYNKSNPQYNDVDFIVKRIERYNPAIFRRLTRCGIPYEEAKEIVRRIVRLTLMYRDE